MGDLSGKGSGTQPPQAKGMTAELCHPGWMVESSNTSEGLGHPECGQGLGDQCRCTSILIHITKLLSTYSAYVEALHYTELLS